MKLTYGDGQTVKLDNPNYTLDGVTNTTHAWQITAVSDSASVTIEDWIYGSTASSPVPVSDTNGIDNVTYHYTGTTSDGAQYDSDTVPTDAGTYTVTATFATTANHEAITATADFTIAKKTAFATWSGLNQVYGSTETVKVTLSGVLDDDAVTVKINETIPCDAGTHQLTTTLTGTDTANYTLKNGTATLTIQLQKVLCGGQHGADRRQRKESDHYRR